MSTAHDPSADNVPRRARPRISLTGVRVLVAEDVEMVRDLIALLLGREQVHVTTVADGASALQMAAQQPFDVILMDMNMPVMGGYEATRKLRASRSIGADTPVLALTANVSKAEIAQCLRAGMDGHVPKPFSPEALTGAIARVLFGE